MEKEEDCVDSGIDYLKELYTRGLFYILHSILLHLDRPTLAAVEQTCKLWQEIVSDQTLWKKLFHLRLNTDCHWKNLIAIRDCSEKLESFLDGDIPKNYPQVYRYLFSLIHVDLERIQRNWEFNESYKTHLEIRSNKNEGVRSLLHNNTRFVCGQENGLIGVYAKQGRDHRPLVYHEGPILCMDWEGDILVSGGQDALIISWDLEKFEELSIYAEHLQPVTGIALKEKKLVSCSESGMILVCDAHNPRKIVCLFTMNMESVPVNCIAFDSKYIISGSDNSTIQIWSPLSGELIKVLEGHKDAVTCLHYNYPLVASGGKDSNIQLWNVDTGHCICVLEGHTSTVRSIRFNDIRLVSCSDDRTMKIWNMTNIIHYTFPSVQCLSNTYCHAGDMPCISLDDFILMSGSQKSCIVVIRDFLSPKDRTYFQDLQEVMRAKGYNIVI